MTRNALKSCVNLLYLTNLSSIEVQMCMCVAWERNSALDLLYITLPWLRGKLTDLLSVGAEYATFYYEPRNTEDRLVVAHLATLLYVVEKGSLREGRSA